MRTSNLNNIDSIQFNTLLISSYNLQYNYLKSIEAIKNLPIYALKNQRRKNTILLFSLKRSLAL